MRKVPIERLTWFLLPGGDKPQKSSSFLASSCSLGANVPSKRAKEMG